MLLRTRRWRGGGAAAARWCAAARSGARLVPWRCSGLRLLSATGEVHGVVGRVLFQKPDYCVFVLNSDVAAKSSRSEQTKVLLKGLDAGKIVPGGAVSVAGKWCEHPQHGKQLLAEGLAETRPVSVSRFILDKYVPGVGPMLAQRLEETFGADLAMALAHDTPSATVAKAIDRLGEAQVQKIQARWEYLGCSLSRVSLVEAFLNKCGMTVADLDSIVARRDEAVRKLMARSNDAKEAEKEGEEEGEGDNNKLRHLLVRWVELIDDLEANPYEVPFVRFADADRVGLALGMGESGERAQAVALNVLVENAKNGHTMMSDAAWAEEVGRIMPTWKEALLPFGVDESLCPVVKRSEEVYRQHYRDAQIDKALHAILDEMIRDHTPLGNQQPTWEPNPQHDGKALTEEQIQLVKEAVKSRLYVLKGHAGSGKTFLIGALASALAQSGRQAVLLSPTGKAAARLTQVTGEEASTIHSYLARLAEVGPNASEAPLNHHFDSGFGGELGVAALRAQRVLTPRTFIIDEASMLPTPLLFSLLYVCRPLQVILVGDPAQLVPVQRGNPFQDIIASGRVPVGKMTRIFRQKDQTLLDEAHRVRKGKAPDAVVFPNWPQSKRQGRSDAVLWLATSEAQFPEQLLTQVIPMLEANQCDVLWSCHFMSPVYKGPTGVANLNKVLRDYMNSPGDSKLAQSALRLGLVDSMLSSLSDEEAAYFTRSTGLRLFDKVVQTKNVPDGPQNGEIGVITGITIEREQTRARSAPAADARGARLPLKQFTVTMCFGDVLDEERRKEYQCSANNLNVDLGYCTTVHKSQGSQFQAAVVAIFRASGRLLHRNMLYTAATRAEQLLVIAGDAKAVEHAVATPSPPRDTNLDAQLSSGELHSLADLGLAA